MNVEPKNIPNSHESTQNYPVTNNTISELSTSLGKIKLIDTKSMQDLPEQLQAGIVSSLLKNDTGWKDLRSLSSVCRAFVELPARLASLTAILPGLSKKFATAAFIACKYNMHEMNANKKEMIAKFHDFNFSNVSPDKVFNLIKDLPNCTSLTLTSLDRLNELPSSLKKLTICNTSMKDEHISQLKHLVNLETLDISKANEITGSSFDSLPPSVKELRLNGCSSVDGLNICKMQHLENLEIFDIGWNGRLGRGYKDLPLSLKELRVNNCPYKGEALTACRKSSG